MTRNASKLAYAELCFRNTTCPLVFTCWVTTHVIFLILRKKRTACKAEQIHKMTTTFIKNGPGLSFWVKIVVILSFVNFLSFASSSFLLSLRKITWLNSQQPETRGHVEHLRLLTIIICVRSYQEIRERVVLLVVQQKQNHLEDSNQCKYRIKNPRQVVT